MLPLLNSLNNFLAALRIFVMKLFSAFLLLFLSFSIFGQKTDEILATANNQSFTAKDLSPEVRAAFENLPKTLTEVRKAFLEQQIADLLLETEAAARKVTVEKLIETQVGAKIPAPTDAQIQAVYDANRVAIGDKTLTEVRPQIIAFLKREPEQKALLAYISALKTKYKVTYEKDVNSNALKTTDILATVNGKTITTADFTEKNKTQLYELEAEIFDQAKANLEETILSALINAEAQKLGIAPGDLIAREITDKMREFSDGEREKLETALRVRLYQKYNAKILLKEPAPSAQNISTENQPAFGKTDAPVTVVMFTDFQCPACSGAHPVLQRVLAEYKDKIRFVVRDFPLTQIHANAYRAALAANAANAQGKFFEYTEILYKNQDRLDEESLKKYAAEAGLNTKQFELDLKGEKFAADVKKDLADGKSYGITGTPTIFVNGVKVRVLSAEAFRAAIEKALNK